MRDALIYETTVDVRYADLDTFGHVNNAASLTLCEEARLDYARDVLGTPDPAFVVAHLDVDYVRPITAPGPVTVGVGATAVGDSSFTVASDVVRDGETAVTAETVLVAVDEEGAPRGVPEDWRAAMTEGGT